ERDVLIERGVLVAGRGLYCGDDLAGDAELREAAEARFALGSIVANRLEQPKHPFLHQIVGIASQQEVRRGLDADEPAVAPPQRVVGIGPSVLGQRDEELVVRPRARMAGAVGNGPALHDRMLFCARGRYSHSNLLSRGWSVAPSTSPEAPRSGALRQARPEVHPSVAEQPTFGFADVNHRSEPMQFSLQDPCLGAAISRHPSARGATWTRSACAQER